MCIVNLFALFAIIHSGCRVMYSNKDTTFAHHVCIGIELARFQVILINFAIYQ
jgi:hypothetical protein